MGRTGNRTLLFVIACSIALALTAAAMWPHLSPGGTSPELDRADGTRSSADSDEDQLEGPAAIDEEGGGSRNPLTAANVDDPDPSVERGDAKQPGSSDSVHRLVVIDLDGRELSGESGELRLAPPGGVAVRVPVREGRFSLQDLPEGRVDIVGAEVVSADVKHLVAFERDWFELRPGQNVLLEGRFLPDSTLSVVDSATGSALSGVRVLRGQGDPKQAHPGPYFPSDIVARADVSPVQLPASRGVRPYWVTAKGHSWSFIQVDHETGGERVVRLESAGKLAVQVDGDVESYLTQSVNAYIRVYRVETGYLAATSDLSTEHWFSGIAAGTYDVRVELNSTGEDVTVLGSTQVDVTHGATTVARVELRTQERVEGRVGVTGDIVLSKEHSKLGLVPSIRIQPVSGRAVRQGDTLRFVSPRRMPGFRFDDVLGVEEAAMHGVYHGKDGNELYRWKAELSSGDYLFVVEPFQYGEQRTVSGSEGAEVVITLPELFPVTIRAIDSGTRLAIDGASVRWSRTFVKGQADGWVETDLGAGEERPGVYLAAGQLSVSARAPGYADVVQEVLIGAGLEQITLEMSRCISRDIVLMHGGVVIPWAQEMTCRVRTLGSDDSQPVSNPGDGTMQACFEEQGLHELLIENIRGFREIPPVQVDVTKGETSPIVVELVR